MAPGKTSKTGAKSGRNLWFWVILAFVVLISAWTVLIIIATQNQPEIIEMDEGLKTND